jgi:hypothetical protein
MLACFLPGFPQLAQQEVLSIAGILGEFESKLVRRRPDLGFEDLDVEDLRVFEWNRLTPSAAFGGTSP